MAYGAGLVERVEASVPGGITAATDLFGVETAEAALTLGVLPARISTIAAGPNPPGGVRPTGGSAAKPDAMGASQRRSLLVDMTVPIAAVFPIEQIRDAVSLQAERHVHGKIVIRLDSGPSSMEGGN